MKKLLSVILCLSLLVALCIPAMAADSRTNAEASSRITLSNNTTLVSEDLPNGDARFTILGEDGCVLSESYLQRSEGLIHYESKLTDSFETRRILLKQMTCICNVAYHVALLTLISLPTLHIVDQLHTTFMAGPIM